MQPGCIISHTRNMDRLHAMEMQTLPANKEVQNIPLCMQNCSNGLLGCQRCHVGGLPSQERDDQCGSLVQHAGQKEAVPTNWPAQLNLHVIILHNIKQWFKQ